MSSESFENRLFQNKNRTAKNRFVVRLYCFPMLPKKDLSTRNSINWSQSGLKHQSSKRSGRLKEDRQQPGQVWTVQASYNANSHDESGEYGYKLYMSFFVVLPLFLTYSFYPQKEKLISKENHKQTN